MRLLIYDKTCVGKPGRLGLTHSWIAGALLYKGLGRFDACRGVSSWEEAFDYLANFRRDHPLSEVQYWGHGKWGLARVQRDSFALDSLRAGHPHHKALERLRQERSWAASPLLWFRTCETVGAHAGQKFAVELADFFHADVAGHTYIIGPWQSGLHRVSPGQKPDWDPEEGIRKGDATNPTRALWSWPHRPNTIHCLQSRIPPTI